LQPGRAISVISSIAKNTPQTMKLWGCRSPGDMSGESANRVPEGLQVRNGRCHNSQLTFVTKFVEV
jgi:hypothetical protein